MKLVRTGHDLRESVRPRRRAGRSIGFVPTMGALHAGHLSLLRAARAGSDVVVLSIFVNPLQFGPADDLATYPRSERRDLERAEAEGVDVAFVPSVDEIYRDGATTTVSVGPLARVLEGASRPGHFDGVATVVAKLFHLVEPSRAFFGQKDAQQIAVIRRMTADLSFEVETVVCPTVRSPDGLALSSRNAYLSSDERSRATVLWRALQAGGSALGAAGSPADAEVEMRRVLATEPGARVDYARVVDPATFEPARRGTPALLVVAAWIGSTRLIDNLLVDS
ncbi:MAG: pantoate--beta-alanine ligase [Actinomycetota bacterium]